MPVLLRAGCRVAAEINLEAALALLQDLCVRVDLPHVAEQAEVGVLARAQVRHQGVHAGGAWNRSRKALILSEKSPLE